MHPDIVNLQKLDGKLFHIKYLVILRNLTVSVFVEMMLCDHDHGDDSDADDDDEHDERNY